MSLDWQSVDSIFGWFLPEEAQLMYDTVKSLRGDVIEIGSYQGRSTAAIAMGIRDRESKKGTVYAVDTFRGSEEHQRGQRHFRCETFDRNTGKINTFTLFWNNMSRLGISQYIMPFIGESIDAAIKLNTVTAELIFIDGSHDYRSVKKDVQAWSPMIRKFIAFHDYHNIEGPTKVVDELLAGEFEEQARAASLIILRSKL